MNNLIKILDNFLFLGGNEKGGSFKYCLMQHLVQKGLESEELKPHHILVEICAGKSALALATIAREYGFKARVYVPDSFPSYGIPKIQELGAEIVVRESSIFMDVLFELEDLHASGECYWVKQNFNLHGKDAYSGLAKKVIADIGSLDSFVCGIGGGTTLQSFGLTLLEKNPALKLFGIFSNDIVGLRPEKMSITFPPYEDMGSKVYLEKLFAGALQFSHLNKGEVEDAKKQLYSLGVDAGDSTAAVHTLMQRNGMKNSLGIGMDAKLVS